MGLNGGPRNGGDAMFLPGAVPGTLEDLEESILREVRPGEDPGDS